MTGKRKNLADLLTTSEPAAVPAQSAVRIQPVTPLAPETPSARLEFFALDPRNHRASRTDPELDDFTARLGKLGQLHPVVVATVAKYEKRFPAEAAALPPEATYVVIMGNRRLRAARALGLPELKFTVNDALLDTTDYREAAMDENLRRLDITCLDEARLLRDFLELDGTHDKVAERIGRSRPYVGQRLKLLTDLIPEAQDAVDERIIVFDQARSLSSMPPDVQRTALARILAAHTDQAAPPETRPAPKPPSRKAAGSMLIRYKEAFGAEGIAELLTEELDTAEVSALVTATARHLEPPELDELLTALTTLRSAATG
jgi:ParB family chromosome partitioning protein